MSHDIMWAFVTAGFITGILFYKTTSRLLGAMAHALGYGIFLLHCINVKFFLSHPFKGSAVIIKDMLIQAIKWSSGLRMDTARTDSLEYKPFFHYRRLKENAEYETE